VNPDPHPGVPGGGFWPKALLAAVARRRTPVAQPCRFLAASLLHATVRKGP
jgi:hypothetical protein